MLTATRPVYEFVPFRVDPAARLLLRDGAAVHLTPKAFDALLLLVERDGQLVAKNDLMKALWPETCVADANLTQTVFMLRRALGDARGGQRYITTVPGRGYR